MRKLDYIQKRTFAVEYMRTCSHVKAAMAIGYTACSGSVVGRQLLEDKQVKRILDDFQYTNALVRRNAIERASEELFKIATADIGKVIDEYNRVKDINDIDDDTRVAIKSIDVTEDITYTDDEEMIKKRKTKIVMHDKMKALTEILKVNKAYEEAIGIPLTGAKRIEVEFV